jgi:hypothetical protein
MLNEKRIGRKLVVTHFVEYFQEEAKEICGNLRTT